MSFGGRGNFHPRGDGRRFPRPSPNMQFGILPLMRPNIQRPPRNSIRRGHIQQRGPRPPFRGRFITPGRGEVVRMGPSKSVQSPSKSDEKDKAPSNEEKKEIKTENKAENKVENKAATTSDSSQTEKQAQKSVAEQVKPKSEPEKETTTKDIKVKEEAEDAKHAKVELDRYNSELHIELTDNNLVGQVLRGAGFQYMWGGVRGTHGVTKGKVCFEVHLLDNFKVDLPEEKNPCLARIGWSVDGSDYQLGEDKLSWGYGGTGKSSIDSKFHDYGKPFGAGDVVTCYIDLETVPKAIFYMLNGEYLGVAFRFTNELDAKALYPHVTVKNMKFAINFGSSPPKYNLTNGFTMIQSVPVADLVTPPPGPTKPEEAEIIMMVGLPGAGKSYWCEKYSEEHKDKKFYILGTNLIIDRMKVFGLTRKRNYHGRWEELINRASKVLNKLFEVAKNTPRNYILDQTNVYFTARRRKMESFRGYKRIAAVIVNKPDVLKWRTDKQRQVEGKIIPDEAINEMKKNYTLPETGPSFNDVLYIEEQLPKAREIVQAYRAEGEKFSAQSSAPKRPSNDDNKHDDNKHKRPREESSSSISRSFQGSDDRRSRTHQPDDRRKDSRSMGKFDRDSARENRPSAGGSRHDSHDSRRDRERSSHRDDASNRDAQRDRFGRDADRAPRRDDRGDRVYGRRSDDRRPPPAFREGESKDVWDSPHNASPTTGRPERRASAARDEGRFDGPPTQHQSRKYPEESKPQTGFRDDRRLPPRREERPIPPRNEDLSLLRNGVLPRRDEVFPPRNDSVAERPYRPVPGGANETVVPYDNRYAPRTGYEDTPPHRREQLPYGEGADLHRRSTVSSRYDTNSNREPAYRDDRDDYPPLPARQNQPDQYERRPQEDAYNDGYYKELPPFDNDRRLLDAPRDVDPRTDRFDRYARQDLAESRRDETLRRDIDQGKDYFDRPPLRDALPRPRSQERYPPPSDVYEERKYNTDRYDDPLLPSRPVGQALDRYPEQARQIQSDLQRYDHDRFNRRSAGAAYAATGRDEYSRERADFPVKDEWDRIPSAAFERRSDYPPYGRDVRDDSYQQQAYGRDGEREAYPPPRDDYRESDRYYDSQSVRDSRDGGDFERHDALHQRAADNKYSQDAGGRQYPGNAERAGNNRNESYANFSTTHHSNDRVSSSCQTQMTTSTANYGHQEPSVTSHSYSRAVADQPPMRQADRPPPPSQQRERYTPSAQSPPQAPPRQPPPKGDPNSSQSYEKQQEDYQKAYSQWYANYAQAYAQLSQQNPR